MAANAIPQLPYTVKQVAEMYDMREAAVLAEIHAGRLPARHKRGMMKCWYMTLDDLKVWAEGMLESGEEDE